MPIDAIDKGNPDISGDPKATQPLNPKQMVGAQKQQINRTRLGAQITNPARQSPAAGGKPDSQAETGAQEKTASPDQPQEAFQPQQGIGPGLQALIAGVGEIQNDPEWIQHPLLHWLTDSKDMLNPGANAQNAWAATQWWGHAVNAAIDPNAMHASAANIEHDNSIQGRIAANFFGINQNSEWAWNIIPYVLTAMAEWPPWMWLPALSASGPEKLADLPGSIMSIFGNDLKHPQFTDPSWYERMGSYVLAAAITAKGGGRAAGPLLKFSGRLKALEPFAAHADRILGGPGDKTPIKGPDGATYDPNLDPLGYAHAHWWNTNAEPLQPGESGIGKTSVKPEVSLIKDPEIEGAYKTVSTLDPKALPELAQKLGMQADATVREVKARLGLGDPQDIAAVRSKLGIIPELRDLSPSLSADILEHWDRYGPALGMWGKIKYLHGGDATFHNTAESVKAISDATLKDRALTAMRAANGLHADLRSGIHAYGNDLVEALTKGVLSHSRSTDHYGPRMVQFFEHVLSLPEEGAKGKLGVLKPDVELRKAITKAIEDPYLETDSILANLRDRAYNFGGDVSLIERQKALEKLNQLEGGEGERVMRRDSLPEQAKWALDFYRRLEAEVRDEKMRTGYPDFQPQPNYVHRLRVPIKNLDQILKGVDKETLGQFSAVKNRILARAPHAHRAVRLEASAQGDALIARTAHMTIDEANAAIDAWRGQLETQMRKLAEANPKLKAIVEDSTKFKALLHSEMPAFSTDIVDSLRGLLREVQAVHTHKVLEEVRHTLLQDDRDGLYHPLAVLSTEGRESAPALAQQFRALHGADTTSGTYPALGYKAINGFQSGGYTFHPAFADLINRAYTLAKGDGDGAFALIRKTSGTGKHLIMLNPLWHATNMGGRFGTLLGANPIRTLNAILKFKGMTKELTPQQAQNLWDLKEHEAIEHGMVTPQLHEDVVNQIQKYHMFATGDLEAMEPLDLKQSVFGIKTAAAGLWNAVKGVDAWWQNSVQDRFWWQYHNLGVLAYIVKTDDNLMRGMSAGDARIMAASGANRIVGMTSPDRWMYNPSMHKISQSAMFAVNWWRTFPGLVLGTYDRMGMKANPALTHAWALNTAKTIGAMALAKFASDNALNWLMSGHWQSQNPSGYQNQITMDRFSAPDPNTGAHMVMEDPFTRQWTDLETALGLTESMKQGGWSHWKPEYAGLGTAEVIAARQSPILQAIESAANFDVYGTIKNRALRYVDPQHPNPLSSFQAAAAAVANLTPVGYAMQAGLQGATAQDGTLNWGPWRGTKIPGWAMRAFDPNDPLSPLLGLLGTRGGYPAPISSDQRGLSTDEVNELHQIQNDWNAKMTKQQQAVMSGGMTWSDWSYNYKRDSAAYANQVQGKVGGTSQYMQGADGLLAQFEATYNNPKAFDQNGDINWAYVQRQQDQLQAQTDPATWRQMVALKDKREMQYPVLRVYKDSLQNYKNYQDDWAKKHKIDGETLRGQINGAAGAPNFQQYEAAHPLVREFYRDRTQWELHTKQGFAYGLFTNQYYVMQVVAPHGTRQEAEAAEQKILPVVEQQEAAGQFVTPTGQ